MNNSFNRRGFIKLAGCTLAAAAAPSAAMSWRKSSRPNIILILSDDQGWPVTSVQMDDKLKDSKSDYHLTPNLEKLASSGMRFSNGYAPHPNCSPSRCSILTGKSPAKLHMTDIIGRNSGAPYEGNRLNPPKHISGIPHEDVTFPELLQKAGYTTAHFGKWHLAAGGPEEHGFDASDGITGNGTGNTKDADNPKDIFGITTRGNKWMAEQVRAGKPFYLQLSHYAIHLKIQHLKETAEKYAKFTKGKRHLDIPYAAMNSDLDTGVGSTLQKIKDLGIEDNTYIIYCSDNGAYPMETQNPNAPLHGWKATIWDGGIRVPFFAAGPGIEAGSQSEVRIVGYDLFPTILELAGVTDPLPDGVEGGSFAPVLKNIGKAKVKRPREELVFHWPHYQLQKGGQPSSAIFLGDYKLLKFYETGELRLYNMKDDPFEKKNLAKKMAAKADQLHERLKDYLKAIDASMPTINPDFDPAKDPGAKGTDVKNALMGHK
jgi:arylsulfatase A-like enzyme